MAVFIFGKVSCLMPPPCFLTLTLTRNPCFAAQDLHTRSFNETLRSDYIRRRRLNQEDGLEGSDGRGSGGYVRHEEGGRVESPALRATSDWTHRGSSNAEVCV